jgi:hypothetical protein
MPELAHRRIPDRNDLALTGREYALLARLSTPERIQRFLEDEVASNIEAEGETILSVRQVLLQRRAHCIEAAFVAACAFWVHGKVPLVMHLDCDICDYPHVIALFSDRGCWGAVSKSRTAGLRFRDPVYRSLRELAMSYFPAYTDKRGRRTLRSYSVAFDMRRIAPDLWVTSEIDCDRAHERLAATRHYSLISRRHERLMMRPLRYPVTH